MAYGGGTHIDCNEIDRLCNELEAQYNKMSKMVHHFETVMEIYRASLDDNIMQKAQEALLRIKTDMESINKYIFEYTRDKQDIIEQIKETEKKFGKRVESIG